MSKVFYDKHIDLTNVDRELKKIVDDPDAREEIYHLIDEIVHHRAVGCILDRLDEKYHEEFVGHVVHAPHDENILDYLKLRLTEDVGEFLRKEMHMLSVELLQILNEVTAPRKSISKAKK